MILEGIVTTINPDGTVNISPMGPIVDPSMDRFTLRPFKTSTTLRNLKHIGQGVLHVTDDVLLLARSAVGDVDPAPATRRAEKVAGFVLQDVCRWYEFNVITLDDSQERTIIECQTVQRGRIRDFFGFNRAKHAVVEAAILATRVHLLPPEEIADQFQHLANLVQKTGGVAEQQAFEFLDNYVRNHAQRCVSV